MAPVTPETRDRGVVVVVVIRDVVVVVIYIPLFIPNNTRPIMSSSGALLMTQAQDRIDPNNVNR